MHQEEIRNQLKCILNTPKFRKNQRCAQFLGYVVEETLANRSNRIKGYNIAVSALGKHESFDPQDDPLVRVLAGRVRSLLSTYYETLGKHDQIVISIPTGCYVPEFTLNPEANSRGNQPFVATSTIGRHLSWMPRHCRPIGTVLSLLLIADCTLRIVDLITV